MTAVQNLPPLPHPPPPPPPPPPADDDHLYHSDDVALRDSPLLEAKKVSLLPTPSPPPVLPSSDDVSSDSSPEPPNRRRKRSHRSRNRPSQGDAVLVYFMDGEKRLDIARLAGQEPLASDHEDADDFVKVTTVDFAKDVGNLAAIAAGALAHQGSTARDHLETSATHGGGRPVTEGELLGDARLSTASAYAGDARLPPSPDASVKPDGMASSTGGLPPIRQHSPKSHQTNGDGAGPITLPSISTQLGDLNHLADAAATGESPYPQSPPPRQQHRYPPPPGHGSPPQSPNEPFRRGLPSPNAPHYYYNQNNHQRMDGHQYPGAGEYSSGTEPSSTDHSGPSPALAIDRMSIDGITNPQIGGFQCTHPGCTAQPFQTQYLLNSHTNVHSSNRPHYCSVKGCPRSEGGKGFKRKNEMIRHGLVHDSPGYVCPFCPDREHKYPRPDNLQRHVRVHHIDKDKEDPRLRDVLAQRPEGPSRGRRRRGGPS